MLLEPLHDGIVQLLELNGLIGDLAQGDHRVLIMVPVQGQRRAGADLPGPLRGQHDQIETIGDLNNAVFDGNPRH